MGCAHSGQKKNDLKTGPKPLDPANKSQMTQPPPNNNPEAKTQQKIQKPHLTKRQITIKRNQLKVVLDEGDFSSVPTYQPFKFDPIVTQ